MTPSAARPRRSGSGWRIGSFGGAPVMLAPSWLLVAAVLTVLFLPVVQRGAPGLGVVGSVLAAAGFPILLFVSVLLHELAHGAAARRFGVGVREYVVTFWGGHTQFDREVGTPGASAAIAAAGPAANAVLAGAGWVALATGGVGGVGAVLLAAATYANGIVAVFNLLPGNPLDGGRILEALVWRISGDRDTGAIGAGWTGRVVAVGIVVWFLGRPLLDGGTPSLTTAVWALLIAGLVWSGASASIRQARRSRAAASFDLRGLVRPVTQARVGASVAELPGGDVVLVDDAGRPVAVVSPDALARVPTEARAATPAGAVATALPVEALVTEWTGAGALGQVARAARTSAVVVLVGPGGVAGLVRVDDVVRRLGPAA
ncbi:peptidase M50 [Beutenbergia cavernae DSM 12333]|uniref:Peptidase M50 n=1 Tax=Beutenbergia cavernae (strain ATCC BAA-8 / DSM 12333 / CCUG 43141 / JCM 11478 / NBRC 16432 / NCIMB 13614 / HKI 0122) TaxID=471853 RepID=C5BVA8_BEUC1|nr:site-2 protease family protein [Beutenbergia cavernae]ACQ80495.1 peptidase M50 [Beutenbergia cavernae DSM 12333]